MMVLEDANTLLVAAAAAALLHHARSLTAAGASREATNAALAVYAQDLERWRAAAYARVRGCYVESPSTAVH